MSSQEKLGLTVCYRTDDEEDTGIYVSEVRTWQWGGAWEMLVVEVLSVPGNVRASALRPECRSVNHQPARVTFNSFRLSV